MKTKLKYICLSAAAGLTLSLSSCSDFMDLTPEDQYDEATVWSDADLAKTVVNDVYSYVCDIAQEVNPDAWTDDAFFTHVYGCRDINEATVSPSNLGAYDRDDCPFKWSKQYKGIYRANLVLANIDNVPEKTGVDLNILKGETYFLRAYIYTELLRGFGGVPIVDKVYSIEEASALNLPRANVADVMDFILKDIEQATNLLPEQQTGVNLGRATKGAAKALKARLLLHVASPLFADRTVNKLECNQYTGDRQALYQQALDAAKDVINDSNYYLFFNYMNRQNNSWISRYNGIVEPNTQIFLEEFGKEELNDLERICVQLIAFKKDKPYSLKNAISVELHLDTVKFYKQHCFMANDFFDEDAMVYPIVRQDIPEKELLISAAELQQAMQQKVHEDRRVPQTIVKKKVTDSSILEVDLHITELLDNTNGLSNADMLDYQLEKFHEVLAKYAANKGQKIVFIHGKGDGVLRKAIEKELKTKYKQYYYQDASFREYGFGATMVTIK